MVGECVLGRRLSVRVTGPWMTEARRLLFSILFCGIFIKRKYVIVIEYVRFKKKKKKAIYMMISESKQNCAVYIFTSKQDKKYSSSVL